MQHRHLWAESANKIVFRDVVRVCLKCTISLLGLLGVFIAINLACLLSFRGPGPAVAASGVRVPLNKNTTFIDRNIGKKPQPMDSPALEVNGPFPSPGSEWPLNL